MNMKKTIGVCATLLTALLCAVPQSARATGKIRAVDVCRLDTDGSLIPLDRGSVIGKGETIYIRFRLVNPAWRATQSDSSFTNPWYFAYTGSSLAGLTPEQIAALNVSKPRLGLWVNEAVREVECVDFPNLPVSDWLSDDDKNAESRSALSQEKHYTDLVFKYTVEPGDLALPIQLADASGKGPADGRDPENPPSYYLKDGLGYPWMLQASKT